MFGKFLKFPVMTSVLNVWKAAKRISRGEFDARPKCKFGSEKGWHHRGVWFGGRQNAFNIKSSESAASHRKPADVGESRGGFSCERHSFDGERVIPLDKKAYEGAGTFGNSEHLGDKTHRLHGRQKRHSNAKKPA